MPISERTLAAASVPERTQSGTPMPLKPLPARARPGSFSHSDLNALEAFQMADGILGHGGLPFIDAREERVGSESDDLAEFVADDLENLIFGGVEDLFVARAAQEAANDGAIFGGAVREFVVDERGGQHSASGAARD